MSFELLNLTGMRVFPPIGLVLGVMLSAASAENLTIRTLALNKNPLPELWVRTGRGIEPLAFSPIQPASPVRVAAGDAILLYERGEEADGEENAPTYRVPAPSGARAVLVLGWMKQAQPAFVALPDNFESAGPRDWLMINAASKTVGVQIGKDEPPFVVPPGSSVTGRVKLPAEGAAEFRAATLENGETNVFFSTFMPFKHDIRSVLLFYPDNERIRVKQMFDMNMGQEEENDNPD